MHTRHSIVVVAASLLLIQTLAIAILKGTTAAALVSDLVQGGLALTCLYASLYARSSSVKASSYHWTWLALSFMVFIVGQSLGTYIDVSSHHSWDWLDDILFSLSVIPIAMLPFLDPDREHSRLDRLHVLDFLQVSCFWVTVYLYFRDTPSLAYATVGWEGFGWSAGVVFHAILTLSFLLRTVLGKSKAAWGFFGGIAGYVLFSGLADSYAALPSNNVQSGHWFDLVWSLSLCIPLLLALTWNPQGSVASLPAHAERIVLNHIFPLVYPFFAVLLLVREAPRNPALSSIIAMIVFGGLGARIVVTQSQLIRAQDTLEYDASHDALTGTYNRAAILESLGKEILRQNRTSEALTVMLADIDHFKSVNDTHGHLVGDQVLIEVARRLACAMRGCDSLGRYGGEEFLLILPNCNASGALTAGERLRNAIDQIPVMTSAGAVPVALSIGFICASDAGCTPSSTLLLRLADGALYQAKAKGRNRVEQADFPSEGTHSRLADGYSHALARGV